MIAGNAQNAVRGTDLPDQKPFQGEGQVKYRRSRVVFITLEDGVRRCSLFGSEVTASASLGESAMGYSDRRRLLLHALH